ncbi:hypothetical protein V1512DRAFT_248538 [Lipomyces arxii]|uniref:uncharacterized protein n=1 Tax=Lipomyces arxii TaxID=56418 RepID=UPI0034CFB27C
MSISADLPSSSVLITFPTGCHSTVTAPANTVMNIEAELGRASIAVEVEPAIGAVQRPVTNYGWRLEQSNGQGAELPTLSELPYQSHVYSDDIRALYGRTLSSERSTHSMPEMPHVSTPIPAASPIPARIDMPG